MTQQEQLIETIKQELRIYNELEAKQAHDYQTEMDEHVYTRYEEEMYEQYKLQQEYALGAF